MVKGMGKPHTNNNATVLEIAKKCVVFEGSSCFNLCLKKMQSEISFLRAIFKTVALLFVWGLPIPFTIRIFGLFPVRIYTDGKGNGPAPYEQ